MSDDRFVDIDVRAVTLVQVARGRAGDVPMVAVGFGYGEHRVAFGLTRRLARDLMRKLREVLRS